MLREEKIYQTIFKNKIELNLQNYEKVCFVLKNKNMIPSCSDVYSTTHARHAKHARTTRTLVC